MRRILLILVLLILLALAGGVVYLASWDMPPPVQTIERPIPDDRLPR